MSDTTTKENTVSPSQEVRELVEKIAMTAVKYNLGDEHPVSIEEIDKVEAASLIQSHIDQVVAPLREDLLDVAVVCDDGKVRFGTDRTGFVYVKAPKLAAFLPACPIPGAKAEETAGAEFLKQALDESIDFSSLTLTEENDISGFGNWADVEDWPKLAAYLKWRFQSIQQEVGP